jgi:hypothetical protein
MQSLPALQPEYRDKLVKLLGMLGSGYERLSGRCARNWASRLCPGFCRENMSICSWKFRRILPSATSYGASRDGHRIGSRWSSRTCASATGGGISGLGATSPPQAATSRTMSYFSIFRSTNLPASAGSYSVPTWPATSGPPGIREKSRLPAVRSLNEALRPIPSQITRESLCLTRTHRSSLIWRLTTLSDTHL